MKKIKATKIIYSVLFFSVILLILFFSYSRIFDEFEYSTFDFRYRLRPYREVSQDIVIVEVGDDSIEKLGKWPFSRKYHALMVKALESAGVKTIIFDIFFSERKDGDAAFAQSVKDSGNVYLPYVFEFDREKEKHKYISASKFAAPLIKMLNDNAKGSGFVNVQPDIDGKIRRIPAFIEYKGKRYPHLSVLAAVNRMGYEYEEIDIVPGERITVGDELVLPLDKKSSILVNYPSEWGTAFRHYSYVDILQSYLADVTGQEATVDLTELEDSICFIGLTATASPDAHPSPLEPLYPGIGVHASVYDSIMQGKSIRRLDRWGNLLILLLMCMLTGYITEKSRRRFALLSIFLIISLFSLVSVVSFWFLGVWIDIFYPIVVIAAMYIVFTFKKYISEIQKREILEKELGIAKEIQQSFLPTEIKGLKNIGVGVRMLTASQVGGDLYDIVQLDENTLGVMMGDVSGKGVPAALYMARVVSVFKTFVRDKNPSEVLKCVNDNLVFEASSNLFVTVTYMTFDADVNKTYFAIGGHLPTVVIEPDGNVVLLDVDEGMPLGLIEGEYAMGEFDYKPGSIFLLYTDGVTEAMDIKMDMYGQDRLVELSKGLAGATTEVVVEAVHRAVLEFAGKAKQHDDITVMAIKV